MAIPCDTMERDEKPGVVDLSAMHRSVARGDYRTAARIVADWLAARRGPEHAWRPHVTRWVLGEAAPPAFARAVERALAGAGEGGCCPRALAERILADKGLRRLLEGCTPMATRADMIASYLEYATCVGPALGRAMLSMENPRYLVLLWLHLDTPLFAPDTWGLWPEVLPVGERWDPGAGEFVGAPGTPWRPVPAGIVEERLHSDEALLFPEGFGRTRVEQVRADAALSLARLVRRVAPPEHPAVPLPKLTPGPTALELAFPTQLPASLVRPADVAAARLGWDRVALPAADDAADDIPAVRLMRLADEHGRRLCRSGRPERERLARRVFGLKLCDWVTAGALLDEASGARIVDEWPFRFDGQIRPAPPGLDAAVSHLGRPTYRGGIGRDGVRLWRESIMERGGADV